MAKRIARLIVARGTTAHAFMIKAIEEKLDTEETQAAFLAEAQRRLAGMKKSGKGIPADEAFDYLRAQVRSGKAKRPKARRLS